MSDRDDLKIGPPTVSAQVSTFAPVQGSLCVSWLCPNPECHKLNHVSWDSFSVYRGISECSKCEKAVHIKEPFR